MTLKGLPVFVYFVLLRPSLQWTCTQMPLRNSPWINLCFNKRQTADLGSQQFVDCVHWPSFSIICQCSSSPPLSDAIVSSFISIDSSVIIAFHWNPPQGLSLQLESGKHSKGDFSLVSCNAPSMPIKPKALTGWSVCVFVWVEEASSYGWM